ncbi:hypothetical protein B0H14DRAFT_3432671 [Mycena olivaceomarginata]|nr:hypothetical protein B0H14DRAFT_3432671 [Mycena olivaceomarginata]
MILDMKVRWSSIYAMLDRGHQLKEFFDTFVFAIARDEKDTEKCQKLTALQLTEDEWNRIDLFLNVLQSAQDAQHAFSADLRSTLHLAIPALEQLHTEWTAKSTKEKYSAFHPAIEEALLKVDEYYQKTSNSNSYMFAIGMLSFSLFFSIPAKSSLILRSTGGVVTNDVRLAKEGVVEDLLVDRWELLRGLGRTAVAPIQGVAQIAANKRFGAAEFTAVRSHGALEEFRRAVDDASHHEREDGEEAQRDTSLAERVSIGLLGEYNAPIYQFGSIGPRANSPS